LPFLHAENYLNTVTPSGQLDIKVINVLRSPETCSPNIDILLYFSAADDFEFQAPNQGGSSLTTMPFYPQIGELECSGIGNSNLPSLHTKYSELSIGEHFKSVKQLLNKPSRFWRSSAGSENAFVLYPWFRVINSIDPTAGSLITPTMGGDMFNYLSFMYMYLRGSVRIIVSTDGVKQMFIANEPASSTSMYAGTNTQLSPGPNATFATTSSGFNAMVAIQEPDVRQVSAEIPYYCPLQCSMMVTNVSGTDTRVADNSDPSSNFIFQQSDATVTALFRSFPDQFQLSYFIGAPPVLISYV